MPDRQSSSIPSDPEKAGKRKWWESPLNWLYAVVDAIGAGAAIYGVTDTIWWMLPSGLAILAVGVSLGAWAAYDHENEKLLVVCLTAAGLLLGAGVWSLPDEEIPAPWGSVIAALSTVIVWLLGYIIWTRFTHKDRSQRDHRKTDDDDLSDEWKVAIGSGDEVEVPAFENRVKQWIKDKDYRRDKQIKTVKINEDGSGFITTDIFGLTTQKPDERINLESHWKLHYSGVRVHNFTISALSSNTPSPTTDISIDKDNGIVTADYSFPAPGHEDTKYSYRERIDLEIGWPMSWSESQEEFPHRPWMGPCTTGIMRYPTKIFVTRVLFPESWKSEERWGHLQPAPIVHPEWSPEDASLEDSPLDEGGLKDGFAKWEPNMEDEEVVDRHQPWVASEIRRLYSDMDNEDTDIPTRPWALLAVRVPWPEWSFGIAWRPPQEEEEEQPA